MARYGRDYGWNQDRWGGGRGYGRGRGEQGGGYGGMRPEWGAGGREPGGQGRYGAAFEGFTGGYDTGYQGATPEDWGARTGGFYGRPGGGYDYGGSGNAGYGYGGGYAGRELGYGAGAGMQERVGWRRGGMQGSRMRAAEIMTENPEAVTPDATIADVARRMKELDVGIIPVVDSQESRRLRGVITDRDITIRAVAEGKDGKARVGDCMTSQVETVNKNDPVEQVLGLMQREQVRRVPVTDREGRLVGIIAQADLAVDYGQDGSRRERMVENTIERISEPASPRRTAAASAGARASSGGAGKRSPKQAGGKEEQAG